MKTMLFATQKSAEEYIADNRLEATGRSIVFTDSSKELETDREFDGVVSSWSGEDAAEVYTDGEEEVAIAWWYSDGEAPVIDIDGEEVTIDDLMDGVYATNSAPAEIDKEAAQAICISCKLHGCDAYTSEDGEEFADMADKLDFTDVMPRRILESGDYIFCLPKDNPCHD